LIKIGILTFHCVNNYGALLQCLALQKCITDLGFHVEIINYIPDYITYNHKIIHFPYNSLKQLLTDSYYFIPHYLRKMASNKFRKKYLHICPEKKIDRFSDLYYDAVIVGSDQVWNPDITGLDGTYFFCDVSSSIKKISYAASIGKKNLDEKYQFIFFEKLKNINSISVREESAAEFIKSNINKDVEVVLDPTLLLDKESWCSLLSLKCQYKKPYILVYCLENTNPEFIDIVNYISNKLKLCVICDQNSFYKSRKFCNIVKTYWSNGPEIFLTYILNAEFVVTNSFHGTAFSLIFNKKFISIPHLTLGSRMADLLNRIGLSERIVTKKSQITEELLVSKIDYAIINDKIQREREKSFAFLQKTLTF
jgi:hypothetical protein